MKRRTFIKTAVVGAAGIAINPLSTLLKPPHPFGPEAAQYEHTLNVAWAGFKEYELKHDKSKFVDRLEPALEYARECAGISYDSPGRVAFEEARNKFTYRKKDNSYIIDGIREIS